MNSKLDKLKRHTRKHSGAYIFLGSLFVIFMFINSIVGGYKSSSTIKGERSTRIEKNYHSFIVGEFLLCSGDNIGRNIYVIHKGDWEELRYSIKKNNGTFQEDCVFVNNKTGRSVHSHLCKPISIFKRTNGSACVGDR